MANEINKIQRRFLWSGKQEGKFSALVKWEVVQRPKGKGGLGVGDILLKNAALLFKWWWHFACEEDALWRGVVQSIHEEDYVVLPGGTLSTLLGPWRDIKRLTTEELPITKVFFNNLRMKVGDGSRVRFRVDLWVLDKPLQ